jgi:hypothetical protein
LLLAYAADFIARAEPAPATSLASSLASKWLFVVNSAHFHSQVKYLIAPVD